MIEHCVNCGEAVERDDEGAWLHTVSPDGIDEKLCVMGFDDGVPYTFSDDDGAKAVPCTDPDCDQTDAETCAAPWWLTEQGRA